MLSQQILLLWHRSNSWDIEHFVLSNNDINYRLEQRIVLYLSFPLKSVEQFSQLPTISVIFEKILVVQNLKIAKSVFIFSKLFVWHLSGEKVKKKEKKKCLGFLIAFLHFNIFFRWLSGEKLQENEYASGFCCELQSDIKIQLKGDRKNNARYLLVFRFILSNYDSIHFVHTVMLTGHYGNQVSF